MSRTLTFEYVLTPKGVERGRRLTVNAAGFIERIEAVEQGPWDGAFAVAGMPNAHSHCFQRALVGARESASADSFWSWRDTMYRIANTLEPEGMYRIALRAFRDMLAAGFTSVGEFHYVHHPLDKTTGGRSWDEARRFEMVDAVREAAREARIRLTMLPALYQRGGFDKAALPEQQRFLHESLEDFGRLLQHLSDGYCGVAPHSLRAVPLALLPKVVDTADAVLGPQSPIHIHISEQMREVEECRAHHGRTPIQCLADTVALSDRWNLVHATHATPEEIEIILASGANLVLCPLTEAYLGDGVFPLAPFAERGGRFAIGSDSNARIDAAEELRLAEFGQRLTLQRRGVLGGAEGLGVGLWRGATEVGARSLGQPVGAIEVGRYADIVVLDTNKPVFEGVPAANTLDAWIISGDGRHIADVYVGGEKVTLHETPAAAARSVWGAI